MGIKLNARIKYILHHTRRGPYIPTYIYGILYWGNVSIHFHLSSKNIHTIEYIIRFRVICIFIHILAYKLVRAHAMLFKATV